MAWKLDIRILQEFSKRSSNVQMVCETYNGHFPTELVLDFPRFDSIGGMLMDDLR